MGIIITLLYIVAVLSALLLVGIVLLQKSKDSGMVAMGSGVGEALFGAQVGNFLIKGTIILGSVFLLSVLAISLIYSHDKGMGLRMRGAAPSAEMPMGE